MRQACALLHGDGPEAASWGLAAAHIESMAEVLDFEVQNALTCFNNHLHMCDSGMVGDVAQCFLSDSIYGRDIWFRAQNTKITAHVCCRPLSEFGYDYLGCR